MKVEKYDKYYSFLTVGNRPNTNHTLIERRAVEHMERNLFMLNTTPNINKQLQIYTYFSFVFRHIKPFYSHSDKRDIADKLK